MKKVLGLFIIGALFSCQGEKSDGFKAGILQKVSHKTFPCDYYEAQIAFKGGVVETRDESSAYVNTQNLRIDQGAYDSLQNYLGENIIFSYRDDGNKFRCGESKVLTSIKIKN